MVEFLLTDVIKPANPWLDLTWLPTMAPLK
jgi:hypothetical protein